MGTSLTRQHFEAIAAKMQRQNLAMLVAKQREG